MDLPLFITCTIALVVLMVYTIYDILSVVDDNKFLQDRCKNIEQMYTDANIERNSLMIQNERLKSIIQEGNCA